MIEHIKNQIISALAKAHAAAASPKGADSLEWVGVAVLIIGAVVIVFGTIVSGGMQELANSVIDKLRQI